MAKRNLIEQLDEAVAAILAGDATDNAGLNAGVSPVLDPRLASLVRIAAELRQLPRQDFKARLRSQLLPQSTGAACSAPAGTAGLDWEMTLVDDGLNKPGLRAHDLGAVFGDLPDMSMRLLASMNLCAIGVMRFSRRTPRWERHPSSDTLVNVLEGELDVTTLTRRGPIHTRVPAGSVFVCRKGLWHRQRPLSSVSMLFVAPGTRGTEHSNSEDPLVEEGKNSASKGRATVRRKLEEPVMVAHDLRGVLSGLKPLAISSATTDKEAEVAFRELGSLNQCGLYVGSFSGMSPWERHDAGDELLHVLDGEADITVLTEGGPFQTTLRSGSVFVCPRGLWHRQYSANGVTVLAATPQPTRISFASDPR